MGKSVYSLVLMDDIVAAVDRLAYQEGTSRSNMVNRILAEYVQMDTPENRIRTIFDAVNAVLGTQSVLQPMMATGDAVVAMRSALQYKYNPSVRYVVELYTAAPRWARCARPCARKTPRCFCIWGSSTACGISWRMHTCPARAVKAA